MAARDRRRLAVVLCAVLLGLVMVQLVAPQRASAHATVVSSDPADGSHLEQSPSQLTFSLDEPATLVDGSAQVIDTDGARYVLQAARYEEGGRELIFVLSQPLPDGAFLATARIVSADTHVVSLSIRFTVGAVTRQGDWAVPEDGGGLEAYLRYPSKGAVYLGFVLSAGVFATVRWLWPSSGGSRRFRRVYRIGAALLFVGLLGRFAVLAAQQSGGFTQLSWPAVTNVAAAPSGAAILVAGVLTLAAFVVLPGSGTVRGILGVAQAVAAVAAVTLGGHGGVVDRWPASLLETLLHVYCVGIWLGGIAALVFVVRDSPDLRQWHRVAGAHVVLVVAAGVLLGVAQVDPLAALFTTSYGLILLTKAAVVVVAVGLGYLSYRAFQRRTATRLPRVIVVESALVAVVVGLTAALSSATPAKDGYTTDVDVALAFGDEQNVRVHIDTVRRGTQQLRIDYHAPGPVPQVDVDLSSVSANVARLPVQLARSESDGSTQWSSEQLIVPSRGRWKVTVRFDGGHGPRLASFFYEVL